MLAIRIDGGLRAWRISGERREAKKDFNTEVTEGRTRRAQRKEKRGKERTQDPGKKPNLGHPAKNYAEVTESAEFAEKRKEGRSGRAEERKRRGNLVVDQCGVEVELWTASPLKG